MHINHNVYDGLVYKGHQLEDDKNWLYEILIFVRAFKILLYSTCTCTFLSHLHSFCKFQGAVTNL
jgi:hypothetical protein